MSFAPRFFVTILFISILATSRILAIPGVNPPEDFQAIAVSNSQVFLTWTDASNRETGVAIERSLSPSNGFEEIARVRRNVTTYRDHSVAPMTTYYYRARSSSRRLGYTDYCNTASVSTPQVTTDIMPPTVPVGLSAATVTCAQVDISWDPSSDADTAVAGYIVYKNGFPIDSTPMSTYSDRYVSPGVDQAYSVTAFDLVGNVSAQSAPLTVTVPSCEGGPDTSAPSVPTGVSANATSCGQVSITWNASTDTGGSGLSVYKLFRNGQHIATTSATQYDDFGVQASSSYSYRVSAVDGAGNESVQSTSATSATPPCPNAPPVANAGTDHTMLAGDTVTFNGTASSDPDGSIVAYSWDFGDGSTGNGAIASHTYPNAGTYWATLTVTDDNGANDSDQAYVDVLPPGNNSGDLVRSDTFGGPSSDIGIDVVVDGSDDVLMAGTFLQTASFGGLSLTSAGSKDIFLVKQSSSGNHIWSVRHGGTTDENLEGITVDDSGDVFICGSFIGTTDLGGTSLASSGLRDIFVAKYSGVDGSHLWSRSFGSPRDDAAHDIDVASNGDVFMTGMFHDAVDFGEGDLTGAYGGQESFIVRLTGAGGAHVWSRTFVNYSGDLGSAIAVDDDDDVFVTGYFMGASDFGGGSLSSAGLQDAYVAKFLGIDGAHLWSRRFGGPSDDAGTELAVDSAGNLFVTGFFKDSVNFGGGTLASSGLHDIFLMKLSGNSGGHLWSRRAGGGSVDLSQDVAVASDGSVLLTGYFQFSADFGAGTFPSVGGQDIFVARYSGSNGAPIWSTSYGAFSTDNGNAIVVDGNGFVLVLGRFYGSIDFGDGTQSSVGSNDTFLLRLWP